MTTAAVHQYLAAWTAFDEAKARILSFVRIVDGVGKELASHPERFHFTNLKTEMPIGTPVSDFDAEKWPTAIEIQSAISAWHQTYETLLESWRQIPQQERGSLKEPPYSLGL